MERYRVAGGAKVDMLGRFKDAPDGSMIKPDMAAQAMHACLRFGGTTVYASDGRCGGFSLSLTAATVHG